MISIIIPAYNVEHYISFSIESALAQNETDKEIIIVNDGSTDRTSTIIDTYREEIILINQKNKGRAAARNAGINKSKGDLIAFLDSDDIWYPEKLRLQKNIFNNYPDINLVFCWQDLIDQNGNFVKHFWKPDLPLEYSGGCNIFERLIFTNLMGSASTVMIRRSALEQIGPFDEELEYVEDWEFWLRFSLMGKIGFVPKYLVGYRRNGDFWPAKVNKLNIQANYERMIDKIFGDNNIPDEYQVLYDSAKSKLLVRAALIDYATAQFEAAKKRMVKAYLLHPDLFTGSNIYSFFDSVNSFAISLSEPFTPVSRSEIFIQQIFNNLPNELTFLKRFRKQTLGYLYAGYIFRNNKNLSSKEFRSAWIKTVLYQPSYLLNRGFMKTGVINFLKLSINRNNIKS